MFMECVTEVGGGGWCSLTSGWCIVQRQVVLVERSGQLQEALDQCAKGAALPHARPTGKHNVGLMDDIESNQHQ